MEKDLNAASAHGASSSEALKRQLSGKNSALEDKNKLFVEREQLLIEKDKLIASKD